MGPAEDGVVGLQFIDEVKVEIFQKNIFHL
jgi:hypothetical protein